MGANLEGGQGDFGIMEKKMATTIHYFGFRVRVTQSLILFTRAKKRPPSNLFGTLHTPPRSPPPKED